VRIPRGFAAGAEIAVSFEPRDRGRIFGDVWERRLVVPSFGATISPNTSIIEKRSFDMPPGRYELRVSVRDLNGDQTSSSSTALVLPDYSRVPVGFADLELGVADSTGIFAANSTRRFGLDVRRIAAQASLFDRRAGGWPRRYAFRWRILDDEGDEVATGAQDVTLARSGQAVMVRPTNSDLFVGAYSFEVSLTEGKSKWRVDRSFEVEESGPPRGKDWDRMLEALSYVADDKDVERLRALPPDQQAQGWEDFWRRRDPSPDTQRNEAMLEFLRRVRYAERHFQGAGPGWRSDMGHVYIKYGAPDQIENRPATTDSPQLEVWYYNQPYRRFVFADREGFGRYTLVSPTIE
jgi:GWxTD domain-containing protein